MIRARLAGFAGALVLGLPVLTGDCTIEHVETCPSKTAIVPGAGCNGDPTVEWLCPCDVSLLACDGTTWKGTTLCACIEGVWHGTWGTCSDAWDGAAADGSTGDDGAGTRYDSSALGDDSGSAAETSAPGSGDGGADSSHD